MKPQFDLTDQYFNTCYAPLCVVGYGLRTRGTLGSLLNFDVISQKKREHTPGEKLMDAFLLIMAGYPSLVVVNK